MNIEENSKKRILIERYLIQKMNEKQLTLGKTKFQKLMYLLSRKGIIPIQDYKIYHFGPFSDTIETDLAYMRENNLVDIKWAECGYKIRSTHSLTEKELCQVGINKEQIDIIEKIIEMFGNLTTKELSILTTALYLYDMENQEITNLIKRIHKLKPRYSEDEIACILNKIFKKYKDFLDVVTI